MKHASFNSHQLFVRNVEKDSETNTYSRVPGTFTDEYFSNKLHETACINFKYSGALKVFGEIELMLYKMAPAYFFEKSR